MQEGQQLTVHVKDNRMLEERGTYSYQNDNGAALIGRGIYLRLGTLYEELVSQTNETDHFQIGWLSFQIYMLIGINVYIEFHYQ